MNSLKQDCWLLNKPKKSFPVWLIGRRMNSCKLFCHHLYWGPFFLTSLIVLGSTYHQLVHHFKTLKMLTLLQTVLLGNDPVTLNIQPWGFWIGDKQEQTPEHDPCKIQPDARKANIQRLSLKKLHHYHMWDSLFAFEQEGKCTGSASAGSTLH